MLEELPQKGLTMLLQISNEAFRLKYVPRQLKVAKAAMVPKPGKEPSRIESYRPISVPPITAKLFERFLLKRLQQIIVNRNRVQVHQFGFHENHSKIQQMHRITNFIRKNRCAQPFFLMPPRHLIRCNIKVCYTSSLRTFRRNSSSIWTSIQIEIRRDIFCIEKNTDSNAFDRCTDY